MRHGLPFGGRVHCQFAAIMRVKHKQPLRTGEMGEGKYQPEIHWGTFFI